MAGFHEARNMSGTHDNLMRLMMNDLGSLRREQISLSDCDENVRPVYHANIEKGRLINQKGSKESEICGKQKQQLSGWNTIHTELGDDGTVTERLDDSSRGQAHRARLLEDPTIREYTPDDDFLPAKRRGGPALRSGLQSSRGGAKVSKHGRIRVPKNIDEGFQALTEAAAAVPRSKKPHVVGNIEGAAKLKWDPRLASPSVFMDRAARQLGAPTTLRATEEPATAGSNPFRSVEQQSILREAEPTMPRDNTTNGCLSTSNDIHSKMESRSVDPSPAAAAEDVTKAKPTQLSKDERIQQLSTMEDLLTPDQFKKIKAVLLDTPTVFSPASEAVGASPISSPRANKPKTANCVAATMRADHASSVTASKADETTSHGLSGATALKRKPSELERPSIAVSLQRAIIERKREETSSRPEDKTKATSAPPRMAAPETVVSHLAKNERGPTKSVRLFKAGKDQNIIGERVHREHFLALSKHTKPLDLSTSPSDAGTGAVSPPFQQFRALSLNDNHVPQTIFEAKARSSSGVSANDSPNIPDSAIALQYAGLEAPANRRSVFHLDAPRPQGSRNQSWSTAPHKRSQVSQDTSDRRKGPALPSFLSGAVAPSDPGAAARLQYGGTDDIVPKPQSESPKKPPVGPESMSTKPIHKAPNVNPPDSRSNIEGRKENHPEGVKEGPKMSSFLLNKAAPIDSGAAAHAQYGMLTDDKQEERFADMTRKTPSAQSTSALALKADSSGSNGQATPASVTHGQLQEDLPMLRKKDPFARGKKMRV